MERDGGEGRVILVRDGGKGGVILERDQARRRVLLEGPANLLAAAVRECPVDPAGAEGSSPHEVVVSGGGGHAGGGVVASSQAVTKLMDESLVGVDST